MTKKMTTTVETNSESNQVNEPSERYQRLLTLLDKSLHESRKALDTDELINECYDAEDAKIFESSETNVLKTAVDSMLEGVNQKVRDQLISFLEKEKIQERLDQVEAIINNLDRQDEEQKRAEAEDKDSAQEAVKAVRLPKDILPGDIISYHAYRLMERERESLLEEIAKVEAETNEVNERIRSHENHVQEGEQKLQGLVDNLRKSSAFLVETKSEE